MSTELLVRIPYEYDHDEEEKSSEFKDEYEHDLDLQLSHDSSDTGSMVSAAGSIHLKTHSSSSAALNGVFSPSETYQSHHKRYESHGISQHMANAADLVRIVSTKECSMLKSNIIRVLCDNNYDIFTPFTLSQFITIFTKILPCSPHDEITKLFHLLSTKPGHVLSFEHILNKSQNFNILLESMGCKMETESRRTRSKLSIDVTTPKYSPNKHREYNVNKPILSWRSGYDAANTGKYKEYIEYQRDLIHTLSNEVNDVYKPLVLQNKEMQIKMQSLTKEVGNLRLEKQEMQNEVQLLERELTQIRKDYDALNVDDGSMQMLQRRMSCSYAEIQESHEFLESEIMELQQNLQHTRRQSNKRNDENYKLQEMNDQYSTINAEIRGNLHRIKKELDAEKTTGQRQEQEMNRLKYELFEKDQRIAMLNDCLDDVTQQMQFMSGSNSGLHKRQKRHNYKRSCSGNHLTMEFDIFSDVVVSPRNSNRMDHEMEYNWESMSSLEVEYDITNNHYCSNTRKPTVVKAIAIQTTKSGFWDTLFDEMNIHCLNP
eukprot:21559_1